MPDNKFITMHPYVDGALDPNVNIYPNIKLSNIKEDASDENTVPLQRQITIAETTPQLLALNSNTSVLSFNLNLLMKEVIKTIFPIGSIFTTFDTTLSKGPNNYLDPNNVYGLDMTWTPIRDTFLYAAVEGAHTVSGDYKVGDVGGSKDAVILKHKHTASFIGDEASETDSNNTTFTVDVKESRDLGYNSSNYLRGGSSSAIDKRTQTLTINNWRHTHTFLPTGTVNVNNLTTDTATIGGYTDDKTGKNMPPYTAVRMWKRTA